MVLDDSNWFAAQKRIRAELEPMADEMRKINCAKPVKSDFEAIVHSEVERWLATQPYEVSTMRWRSIYEMFWNERLN